MIEQLRGAIKNKLDTLTGETQPLSVVYEYMTPSIEWYPCAMINFSKLEGQFGDSCSNVRTYTFVVYIIQEIGLQDRLTAYKTVEDIMVKVANIFDTDPQLDWLSIGTHAVGGDVAEYMNGTDWFYVGGIVQLNIETIYNLWS